MIGVGAYPERLGVGGVFAPSNLPAHLIKARYIESLSVFCVFWWAFLPDLDFPPLSMPCAALSLRVRPLAGETWIGLGPLSTGCKGSPACGL